MKISFRSLSILWRIIIAVATPLLVVIVLLVNLLITYRATEQQANQVVASVALSTALGDLVHFSQRERAFSNVYVFTGGKQFKGELGLERKKFDQAVGQYEKAVSEVDTSGLPSEITAPLGDVKNQLIRLQDHRKDIDELRISRQQTIDFYTKMVEDSLVLTRATTKSIQNPDFIRHLVGMAALVQGKEQAALERSVVVMSLTNQCLNPTFDALNQKLTYGQDLSFSRAESYLGSAIWSDIATSLDNFTGKEVFDSVRKEVELSRVACLSGQGGVLTTDPGDWWTAVTARLDSLREGQKSAEKVISQEAAELAAQAQRNVQLGILGLVLLVLLLFFICLVLVRSITNPVVALEKTIVRVGEENDLTTSLAVDGSDEITSISTTYNSFICDLRGAFKSIQTNVSDLKGTSSQLAVISSQVSQSNLGIQAGASQVEGNSKSLTGRVGELVTMVRALGSKADEGKQSANLASDRLKTIRSTVDQSSGLIAQLSDRSSAIGEIIESISTIASQTNLLALNAAIEAARAGEAGRGFAVVADEVRKLAEESQHATNQIGQLIQDMRSGIDSTVSQITLTTNQVSEGSDIIQQALSVLSEIAQELSEVTGSISQLSELSRSSQTESERMGETIQKSSEQVDKASVLSQQLDQIAGKIDDLVSKFKV